jgi:hypothetical protein
MPADTAKKQVTKCSIEVRNFPLEAFRLAGDGRKWKQSARTRKAVLLHLSSYANPDGTFMGSHGRNFSPSHETLLDDFSKGGIHHATTALRELGLLSWTRKNHYERRVYTIHLPEHSPDSSECYTAVMQLHEEKHSQDSAESLSTFDAKGPEHSQHSSITLSTSDPIPSLPTKERADKDFPTTKPKPIAALSSPSAHIKTNPKGAGKGIQRQTEPARAWIDRALMKCCEKCGDEHTVEAGCPEWSRILR